MVSWLVSTLPCWSPHSVGVGVIGTGEGVIVSVGVGDGVVVMVTLIKGVEVFVGSSLVETTTSSPAVKPPWEQLTRPKQRIRINIEIRGIFNFPGSLQLLLMY